jgi:hypothetical protein
LALISATLFLELVGGLGLEGLSVGCLGSLLNLCLLSDVHFSVILGVLGASEGSGTSFLLLHVKLLDLSFHPVHLHGNLLRLVAVVLDNLENVDPRVDGGLGLGVLNCLDVLPNVVLLSKLHVHVVLGNGEGGGGGELLVVGGEGGGELLAVGGGVGKLLVVGGEGGGELPSLLARVANSSATLSLTQASLVHFQECITK